jgi:hypothetical protein
MRKHVLLLGLILVICSMASGQLLHPRYIGPLPVIEILTSPNLFPYREPISLDLAKPMNVKVMPWRPTPTDEVVVTISGSTFVPYLTADDVDLQIDGSDITLDIHWISSPPLLPSGILMEQFCSVGTVYEPVQFVSPSSLRSDRYEVTKSLGTFSPGTYKVEINNSGRLTGTVSTSFTVRNSSFDFGGIIGGW